METGNIQQVNKQTDLAEKECKPNLTNALITANKQEMTLALREYKQPNGVIYFPALFSIKSEDRLPELAKNNFSETLSVVVGGLTLSFEAMNLTRSMNDNQIIDLAETILDSSNEDNLALEDVMLFLQKLTRGEYGKLYESMDIPKFMEFFEKYREERFQAMQELRYEQSVQSKSLPINDRLIDMFGDDKKEHRDALKDYLRLNFKESDNSI
jgi:hypothetical protein